MDFVGKKLSSTESKEMLDSFKKEKDYSLLINEIKKVSKFEDNESFKVTLSFQFDTQADSKYFSSKAIEVTYPGNIVLDYQVTTSDLGKSKVLTARIYDNTQTVFINVVDGKVEVEKEKQFTLHQLNENKKNEPDDPFEGFEMREDYYPGILKNTFKTQAPWHGCLPGGYMWCGQKCGGKVACTTAKTGINPLDRCCQTHDCCYHQNKVGLGSKKCDCPLCNCAMNRKGFGKEVVAARVIIAVMCMGCTYGS